MSKEKEAKKDKMFRLCKGWILMGVMGDYGIDTSALTHKTAEHLVDDFMAELVKQGYAERKGDKDG